MQPFHILSDLSRTMTKLRECIAEMRAEYLREDHAFPWIIGFSGGKDSTLMVHLVFEMLLALPRSARTREVIVLSNDTLVESPVLAHHLEVVLRKIAEGASILELPVRTVLTKPEVNQTFWVNLIGRGYPSPNRQFRWCTDRLKIQPTSNYIRQEVSARGQVILLLGVRSDESNTRAQSVAKHSVAGSHLHPHSELENCFVYRPILGLSTAEVWHLLLQRQAPWGGTHRDLVTLYRNAEGGECPLILDTSSAPSCGTGSSRFGCWTCTVVVKDRSMEGLIDAGMERLEPLLEFRDWLQAIRDHPEYRQTERRNGLPGLGPYTIDARKKIMLRLFETQQRTGFPLISEAEIEAIERIWEADLVTSATRLFESYREVISSDEKLATTL